MDENCIVIKILESIAPIVSSIAAIASFFAVLKANEIAKTVKYFQRNTLLNQREIELIGKALEKLNIYNVWCKEDSAGIDVNYHDSNETEYNSRDDACLQIPIDVKFILIQLTSHSEKLEFLLLKWEEGFILKSGKTYHFNESLVSEKIQSLRAIRSGGL
ncbi:hypothetical protein [Shewanella sp. SR43-8]|uniref:hypothetical protein n=1 Tax=Shewanella sp. SR43-8 TaxID=2760938 RepID=UPI0015FF0CF9|nr:hypothetical protein [Shewanella sp. SR43-8]MBB1320447.1 hypothetical protein [Shewanella sp. SR43-8]|tara:strand:+ start:215 stop:694 length:480 start_codon:yes stop_codon:yes gene_type:complete